MTSTCMEAAHSLGILNYLSPHENFSSDKEKIEEALYRASAVCVMAYESGKQNYEEFSDAIKDLKDFCSNYGFDFGEYCQDLQNYDTIETETWEEMENIPKKGRYCL